MPDKKEQLTQELVRASHALAMRINPKESAALQKEIIDLAGAIIKIALWSLARD